MKISIVVPVHNAGDHVQTLLQMLPKTEARSCEQVFVDDASALVVRDMLLRYAMDNLNVSVLRNSTQQLFTRTVNRGIRAVSPDTTHILEINTDCMVYPGFINAMLEAFEMAPNVAIVGYPDGKPEETHNQKVNHPDYVTGHCMMAPMNLLGQHGLLCETDINQAHISSERLWCWKLFSKGYIGVYVNKPLVIHDAGGPSWNRDLGWLQRFNYNQLWPGRDTL